MQTDVFLRNKIKRQIKWNGQQFVFKRYKLNNYSEIDYNTVDEEFIVNGIFHEGGGYGGMLNIELFERDGARTTTKMKPMILCLYEEGHNLDMDDVVEISDYKYKIVDKQDIKNLGVAYEISMEVIREYGDGNN